MRKLIYSMSASLDGYIAAPGDNIDWSEPSDEVHWWFNDRARTLGMSLYGRRIWELMSAHWPTADEQPNATPVTIDFAKTWRAVPKVVFSKTVTEVDWNARIHRGDAVEEITRLKTEDGGDMEIAGATLAGTAMRAGLIDEYEVMFRPILLGAGKPFFSSLDNWVNLRLLGTQTFTGDAVLLRYETRR